MDKQKRKVFTFWVVLCELVGIISGFLSRDGIREYSQNILKPAFTPPSWLFPLIWTILFALMGFSAAHVYLSPSTKERSKGLNLFVVQLVVNFFWPLFFFNLQAFGFSFFWLILLWIFVVLTVTKFKKIDKRVAWLLVPYLLWLTFAAVLNGAVWLMNT